MCRQRESPWFCSGGGGGRLLIVICLACCGVLPRAARAEQMNVLFIAIDDLKQIPGYLSEEPGNFLPWVYPDPARRAAMKAYLTPNLDRLAAEGVVFTHAHCAAPACLPSRTALMIGMRPADTNITTNGDVYFRESPDPAIRNAITLSQNLIANGYYAAGLGKIYHTNAMADPQYSWTDWLNRPWGTTGSAVISPWSPDRSYPDTNVSIGYVNTAVAAQNDYVNADFIAEVLENGSATIDGRTVALPAGKPFFLACGIFRPHLPFYAPKELLDLFDPNDLTVTRQMREDVLADVQDLSAGGKAVANVDADGKITSGDMYQLLQHGLSVDPVDGDLKAWRELIRHYLASAALADRCVGRLLEGLANSPYANNTLVVLWSDHGWSLGEKNRLKKFTLWNESAQCVLIIKDPNQPQSAGSLCRHPVNLQDLYRTVSAKCGVPVPMGTAGRDISYLLAHPDCPGWDHATLTTTDSIDHTIRNDGHRYIRFDNNAGNDELYDESADPHEIVNLVANPAYDALESEMDSRLNTILAYAPGLQAQYLFAGDAQDSSGRANHGTTYGGVTYGAGVGGTQAVVLNGTDSYVEIPRSIGNDFTVAFWVNTSQTAGAGTQWHDGSGLVDGDAGGDAADFGASLLGGKVAFGVGGPDTTIVSTSDINNGAWRHVTATRDGATGQIKLYVDGHEEASALGPLGVRGAAAVLHIGKLQSGGGYFQGSIDDLRLYNLVLSADDMRVLVDATPPDPNPAAFASVPTATGQTQITMTAAVGADPSGPVQYYFDETSGNAGGSDSGWQTDPNYSDTGLEKGTPYTYTVRMRDTVGNETGPSSPASAYTWPDVDIIPDLVINLHDLAALVAHWLDENCYSFDLCGDTDLNASGRVNLLDFGILAEEWLVDKSAPVPQAWYEFEGNVQDSAGTNHGSAYGGPGYGAGKIGSLCLQLDGVDDYVAISRPVENDWTIALWIQTDEPNQAGVSGTAYRTGRGLVDSDVAGQTQSWAMTYHRGKIQCGASSSPGGAAGLNSNRTIADSGWHHVAWVRQAATGQMWLYIDGQLDNSGLDAKWIGTKDADSGALIGSQNGNPAEYFHGRMDDLRFYDYLLSDTAIAQLAGR